MPDKTANPSKQPEPEKNSDAAKLPNAPPKQEKPQKKPPDQTASANAAPAPAGKKPSADKAASKQPIPAPEGKPPAGKAAAAPIADEKAAEATASAQPKAAEHKSLPAEKQKKAPAPAKLPEKAPDTQKAESKAPVKLPVPEAAAAQKPNASAAPADKGADTKAAPKPDEKKPDTKAAAAPIAETKKAETPLKPTLNRPAPPPARKAEPSAKIMLGGKLHDPITPPKAADPLHDPGESKGVRVTQIFEDRLDYPDEKALNSLPIPKEGEGFSMRLHPAYFYQFLDHPFSVNREVKDYIELYESIRDNGINEPVKARPRAKGGLELISGHRRHDIAKRLNYPVPVIIAQVDDDTARVEVVDGNLHRMDIPTSELARAAKMKMDALARKAGRRSKMEILANPEPQKRTDQIVADEMGISRNQVNRLVKINDLVPELKQQVDDKKLPFNTAVELAYMKPDEQDKVVEVMKKEQIVPSMAQATALKEASRHADALQKNLPALAATHKIDEIKIASIIKPKKEPELKVTFTGAELKAFFPNETPSVAEVKRVVFEALRIREEAYKRQAKKQAAKDAIKSPEH